MDVCPDYEDLFKILNKHGIKYLLIGAHAVIYYTLPRYTKNIDVCISPDLNDPEKIWTALKDFGAPLHGVTPADFKNKKLILQIGLPPVRIDILTRVAGFSFKDAWKNKIKTRYGKTPIYILSLKDLIKSKKKLAGFRINLIWRSWKERCESASKGAFHWIL